MNNPHSIAKKLIEEGKTIEEVANILDENSTSNLNLVNELIKQSFGKSWKGNYNDFGNYNISIWGEDMVRETNSLRLIGKKRRFLGTIFAGKFLNPDGSEIVVFPKYASQAREYAGRYQLNLDKKVKIQFREEISP